MLHTAVTAIRLGRLNKASLTLLLSSIGTVLGLELARNKKRGLCCPRYVAAVPGVETLPLVGQRMWHGRTCTCARAEPLTGRQIILLFN